MAEGLLSKRGVPFEKIMVDYDDEPMWDKLYEMSGMKTVPQIWSGERLIGGWPELSREDAKDQLASLKD
jgi:glutaredoxin 3